MVLKAAVAFGLLCLGGALAELTQFVTMTVTATPTSQSTSIMVITVTESEEPATTTTVALTTVPAETMTVTETTVVDASSDITTIVRPTVTVTEIQTWTPTPTTTAVPTLTSTITATVTVSASTTEAPTLPPVVTVPTLTVTVSVPVTTTATTTYIVNTCLPSATQSTLTSTMTATATTTAPVALVQRTSCSAIQCPRGTSHIRTNGKTRACTMTYYGSDLVSSTCVTSYCCTAKDKNVVKLTNCKSANVKCPSGQTHLVDDFGNSVSCLNTLRNNKVVVTTCTQNLCCARVQAANSYVSCSTRVKCKIYHKRAGTSWSLKCNKRNGQWDSCKTSYCCLKV